jgi:hypothetical protein
MVIDKHDFVATAGGGDVSLLRAYVAQTQVAAAISSLEQVIHSDFSMSGNLRTASRTLMAASRGLWFCTGGAWDNIFRRAIDGQHVEVLAWFFSEDLARSSPVMLQVVFLHVARLAVSRNGWLTVEMLLESWLFREVMTHEMKAVVLNDLHWNAHAHGFCADLLLAHGAEEIHQEAV